MLHLYEEKNNFKKIILFLTCCMNCPLVKVINYLKYNRAKLPFQQQNSKGYI